MIFKNYFGSAKTSKEDVIRLFYIFQNFVDFFVVWGAGSDEFYYEFIPIIHHPQLRLYILSITYCHLTN